MDYSFDLKNFVLGFLLAAVLVGGAFVLKDSSSSLEVPSTGKGFFALQQAPTQLALIEQPQLQYPESGMVEQCSNSCGYGTRTYTCSWSACSAPQPTTEMCNGRDDNCNGQIDEGELCPAGWACDVGNCKQLCRNKECPQGKTCGSDGFCY